MKYLILILIFSGCAVNYRQIDSCTAKCSVNNGVHQIYPEDRCVCKNGAIFVEGYVTR